MISLCMIVKNEESHIERCLLSVKEHVDEMIVIDTGSTDRTKEICERLGASVYSYAWTDDFSAARNYGLELCRGKWILWLDADETLDAKSAVNLQKKIEKTPAKVMALPIYNYYGNSKEIHKNHYHLLYQPRLFRNDQGITFENPIHESLKSSEGISEKDVGKLKIPIHHYGYTEDILREKNKSIRNVSILQDELMKPDHSPWIEYHLASEFYRLENYETAFQFVNHSIMMFLTDKIYPPSLLYKLKYDILIQTENWEGAWPGIEKAIELYPDYVDLHYDKGLILFKLKKYQQALEAFEKCLALGDENSDYLVLKGVGSFKAQTYYDKCVQLLMEEDLKES